MRSIGGLAVRAPVPGLRRGVTAGVSSLTSGESRAEGSPGSETAEAVEGSQPEAVAAPGTTPRMAHAESIGLETKGLTGGAGGAGPLPYSPPAARVRRAELARRLGAAKASPRAAATVERRETGRERAAAAEEASRGYAPAGQESVSLSEGTHEAVPGVAAATGARSAPRALDAPELSATTGAAWTGEDARQDVTRGPDVARATGRRAGVWWVEAEAEEDLRLELVR